MKVVYTCICAAQSLKMGSFQSDPSLKNKGGGVGTKTNKETLHFFKAGSFGADNVGKVKQTNVYF